MRRIFLCGISGALLAFCGIALAEGEAAGSTPPAEATKTSETEKKAEDTKTSDAEKSEEKSEKEDSKRKGDEVTYTGIGLSRASTDFDNLKEAINLAFVLGIKVPTIDWISAELEFATTVIPGQNTTSGSCGLLGCTPSSGNVTQSQNDLGLNTVGVFGVLKSPGRFYGLGKYGYRYIQSSIEELQMDRSGNAWGGGVGYRWGETLSGVELTYVRYSSQLRYMTLSISYGFGGHKK